MKNWATVTLFALLPSCALAQPADVAIVEGTFTAKKRPASARTVKLYCGIVQAGLRDNGVQFRMLTQEQVVEGKLADCKLAIFPFNPVCQEDEMAQVADFVERGGKLLWFYTVPPALRDILGIARHGYRGKKYEGEFHVMQFAGDRPPGFPAQVHQNSPNSRIVEQIAEGSRAIAVWHDKKGKDTGVPAVVLSANSVWISHVFWQAANTAEQRHLLLATVGHFVPGKWTGIIEGALAGAASAADCESLDALAASTRANAVASAWARKALSQAEQARQRLAAGRFGDALALAKDAQSSAQTAAAAAFPSRPYELRGAWMGRPADATDWDEIMSALEAGNFNAIFPLMCGPATAAYPSQHLRQRTKADEMKACLDAARRHGIEVHVWRANWQVLGSEGRQRFIKEGRMVLSVEQALGQKEKSHYQWSTRWLDPSDERNRELEFNAMIELVEKYHPAGIHFDFMRYPERRYCYCNRCRDKFEAWAGIKVEKWPHDCWTKGKHLAKFRDWRRHLQTSLVKRIAERAHEIDPNVKVSLAARASMRGSFESDAQDWVTWAKEGYLDMLCPMDYTSSVEVLRKRLAPQIAAIDGAVPVYAGLGVSPRRSATPLNLSQQIRLARELGADGFLLFSWTAFSRAMLPPLKLGATSVRVDVMPHHAQPAAASFEYPEEIEGCPKRVYAVGKRVAVGVTLAARSPRAQRVSVRAFVMPAAGGPAEAATKALSGPGAGLSAQVRLPSHAGVHQIILRGEVTFNDRDKRPYYLRSLPMTVLTREQMRELLEAVHPRK